LVVQVAAAGDPLDSREHAGIKSQSDRGGFADVELVQRHLHQPGVQVMGGPEVRLFLIGFKLRDLFPGADDLQFR
jgi:hypothetical protein